MRNTITLLTFAFALLTCIEADAQQTASVTTKNTSVKDVMKLAHKKPNELLKKVAMGKATKQQQQQLYDLYAVMAKHQPAKGGKASWTKKTTFLVDSVKDVMAGKPNARARLSKASNCKSCHAVHK